MKLNRNIFWKLEITACAMYIKRKFGKIKLKYFLELIDMHPLGWKHNTQENHHESKEQNK